MARTAKPAFERAVGVAHRQFIGAQNHGDDVRITRPRVESGLLELFTQEATRLPTRFRNASPSLRLHCRPNLAGEVGRQSGVEDESARPVDEELFQRLGTTHEGSRAGQGLATRINGGQDSPRCSGLRHQTSPLRAQDAHRVRLIHDQFRAVTLRHATSSTIGAPVAVHAEHAFHDNEFFLRPAGEPSQLTFQEIPIPMRKYHLSRARNTEFHR